MVVDGSRSLGSLGANGAGGDPAGPRLIVAAGLVWLDGETLLVQRRSATARHGAGMLELPGGKLERGEGPREALCRELREEWGAGAGALEVGAVAEVLHHCYAPPGPEVILIVHHVDGRAWSRERWRALAEVEEGAEIAAYAARGLPLADFLSADQPFLDDVREGRVRPPAGFRFGFETDVDPGTGVGGES